jgi:hypothetical protein
MTSFLKDSLLSLKDKLNSIESQLDLKKTETQSKSLEDQAQEIIKYQNNIIRINVGGEKFATRPEVLLGLKDTLFYKIILTNRLNLKEEIFFDRSPKYFSFILDYIRYKKINIKHFNKEELEELKEEADYYEIGDLNKQFEENLSFRFVSFETNGSYSYNGATAGTNNVEDLNDTSLNKGICATSPGWIILEMNTEIEIEKIDIGGWNGNTTLWAASNGSGATIYTSEDKVSWKQVGTIPGDFGAKIQTVSLSKSTGKYLKFQCGSYLGIGYLKVN